MTSQRVVFRTSLCDLLGIDYPILQSGMGLIAGPDLVAEVSAAGGLGIVAGFMLTADQLRAAIRTVRAKTNRPFGVNLWLCLPLILPIGLMPPAAGIRDAVHRRAAPSPLCPDSAAAQPEAWVRWTGGRPARKSEFREGLEAADLLAARGARWAGPRGPIPRGPLLRVALVCYTPATHPPSRCPCG